MVTAIVKQAMASGAPTGFSLDVLDAIHHANQDSGDQIIVRPETVCITRVVDAERTWGPTDARCFEMAKDRLNELSVV